VASEHGGLRAATDAGVQGPNENVPIAGLRKGLGPKNADPGFLGPERCGFGHAHPSLNHRCTFVVFKEEVP